MLIKWGRVPCGIYSCVRSRELHNCKSCDLPACKLHGTSDLVCPLRSGLEDKKNWAWRLAQHLDGEKGGPCHARHTVPLKTIVRLRWYLGALEDFRAEGRDVVSSRELANKLTMNSAMVRKDLSHCGELGTPGLGYRVAYLQDQIQSVLTKNTCLVVWVGAQWMKDALNIFASSLELNFRIVAVLDSEPELIGTRVGEWEVLPLSDIGRLLSGGGVDGAVLAVQKNPQRVADLLIQSGAKGILNLTPVTLVTPAEVNVRHVDILGEMMALAMECSGE